MAGNPPTPGSGYPHPTDGWFPSSQAPLPGDGGELDIQYASVQECLDGGLRSNCVVQRADANVGMLDLEKGLCNKPMVATIPFVWGQRIRVCRDCLDMFIETARWQAENPGDGGAAYLAHIREQAEKYRARPKLPNDNSPADEELFP